MPEVRNPGVGAGQQALLVATVNLTAAQIRALHNSPAELVPAPGVGKIIVPFGIAMVYGFGTKPFQFATGGSDNCEALFQPIGSTINLAFTPCVGGAISLFGYAGAFPGPTAILPGADNQHLVFQAASDYTNGSTATATLGAGGAGYAANDTGTITTGSGDATYKVLTVDGGGAVLTFQITGAGTSYAVGNGQATAVGGAQPGVGAGFTVNITAVSTGDGTLKVVTYYQIIPVP